jgi:hypothetical protein
MIFYKPRRMFLRIKGIFRPGESWFLCSTELYVTSNVAALSQHRPGRIRDKKQPRSGGRRDCRAHALRAWRLLQLVADCVNQNQICDLLWLRSSEG